jgi:hypothetical protein
MVDLGATSRTSSSRTRTGNGRSAQQSPWTWPSSRHDVGASSAAVALTAAMILA